MLVSILPEAPVRKKSSAKLPSPGSRRRVKACYSLFDAFFPRFGMFDFTEGIYDRPETSFEAAQANQHRYLLDQAGCAPGARVLDIGCGYGALLARAQARGAIGVGVTLSREQARRCRAAGLDVRLLDFRSIDRSWERSFDAIVANGSLEHFAAPADAAAGRDDAIYREMFRIARRLIDPDSAARRFVTTAIHFHRAPRPAAMGAHPWCWRPGSDDFHFAMLNRAFGGWYPVPGQLERCAAGLFELADEVDGTEDYRRTSEEWLARSRRALGSWAGARTWLASLPTLVRHPLQSVMLYRCLLVSESWNWQFRPPAPTRLLRQTWTYRE